MTACEPLDLSRVERLLVVKLSSLGDVVHATPMLRAFRAAWPSAHITLAVDRAYVPLVACCPWIDDIVPASAGRTRLARWREAASQLGNMGSKAGYGVLVEGLESERVEYRFKCYEALRELTGHTFGYVHNAPDEERAEAVAKWKAWLELVNSENM